MMPPGGQTAQFGTLDFEADELAGTDRVTESEILDRAALESYSSALDPAMQAASGQFIGGGTGPTEKITAVVGDPPKRFGVVEFENLDKAAEKGNAAFQDLPKP